MSWRDAAAQCRLQVVHDLDAVFDTPLLGVRLALTDIYDRVTLRAPIGPRLVWPDEPAG